jgi:type I restriction enzyme M protein
MTRASNKYCSLASLRNESDVEQFLVLPLLADLGYGHEYLKTKATIATAKVGKGAKRRSYAPDYLAYRTRRKDKPVLVIDAKHPDEPAESGVEDAQMYASVIRRQMTEPKPVQYCIGVNGHRLIVKDHDSDTALHVLSFKDFQDGNPLFGALVARLSRSALAASPPPAPTDAFEFRKVSPVELPAIFEACHRMIWKAEKRMPASAFYEFAKIMFVKIDEDRRLHESVTPVARMVPTESVRFSVQWIEKMEPTTDNPINTILFARLVDRLEEEVASGDKKRIFEHGEGIDLAPSTIKDAVAFLEHLDLYAVDEDLNGRLFETFLTATMRGEALGQFFTPRSVVKFMVEMAALRVSSKTMDLVLDGCCGTGGFLIQAMAAMGATIERNRGISRKEKDELQRRLRTDSLWGIDVGKDPMMARIARLNMLLHKDGGSRIYYADALDKQLQVEPGLPLSVKLEIGELRTALDDNKTRFSAVLSNPPFSMNYERKKPKEWAILQDYELSIAQDGKPRASLRSSVMFLERYWDLLMGDGRLITVMDESILNTLTARPFREYLLKRFVLRAVIGLPKNTFVKAQGSVQTSVLYLRKKTDPAEPQPDVFMALCGNVGHTDSGKERPHLNELPALLERFQFFEEHGTLRDAPTAEGFTVANLRVDNATLRLDAPYFDPRYFSTMATLDQLAADRGWKVEPLRALLRTGRTVIAGGATPRGALYPDDGPKFIRVQNVRPNKLVWDPEKDPSIDTRTHTTLLKRSQLNAGDVVLTITGTYGVAAVVPDEFGEANINQHSVKLELNTKVLPEYLALFLNSRLCRPQFDRAATGSSRLALDYEAIRNLRVLYPPNLGDQRRLCDAVRKKLDRSDAMRQSADDLDAAVADAFTIDSRSRIK